MPDERSVPLADRYLMIEGRASPQVLIDIADGFSRSPHENEVVLFATFAYADLPIGKEFEVFFRVEAPSEATFATSRIREVTQQFAKPIVEVPQGWKTILLVEFPGGIPDSLRAMPEVDSWYENRDRWALASEQTWRALTKRARS